MEYWSLKYKQLQRRLKTYRDNKESEERQSREANMAEYVRQKWGFKQ